VEPNRDEYVRLLLGAYRQTPGTTGSVRRQDHLLAAQLYQRGVPLMAVENALLLAAARRLLRPTKAAPLGTIRSLAYFLPVIDEVLDLAVSPDYFQFLRGKIARFYPNTSNSPTTS
jgi:hypothetical protein